MCGIFGLICKYRTDVNFSSQLESLQKRGPDQTKYLQISNTHVGFTRLSIMQLNDSGMQPYVFNANNRQVVFICNGEIYNFKDLIQDYQLEQQDQAFESKVQYKLVDQSEDKENILVENRDCLVIPLLYLKLGFNQFCELFKHKIKGEFAFALFEFNKSQDLKNVILGRDLLGIRPLYISKDSSNDYLLGFASSVDSLSYIEEEIQHFEPGTIQSFSFSKTFKTNSSPVDLDIKYEYSIKNQHTVRFDWIYQSIAPIIKENQEYLADIRNSLINAVKIRLNADQPICFLLSGGLDSSLVCSIAQSLSSKPIHTFCCGIAEKGEKANTNDIINARKVSEFIGSIHTEVTFTREEALNAIPEVIKNIGTWCQTTIRASTPMYLLCKYIKEKTPFKVVFTGEVSDELFSGYLYNYELQKNEQIDISSKLMLKNIHKYDVLRADGCISQNSLESRVPFSDQDVIRSCWQIPSELRHPKYKDCEKYWLRQAFNIIHPQNDRYPGQYVENPSYLPQDQIKQKADSSSPKGINEIAEQYIYLPVDVLFRTKVAFSNSIADNSEKSWIQSIKDHCLSLNTNELQYYLDIFKQHFGANRTNILENHWQPHRFDSNGQLVADFIDSSAEVLDIYKRKFNIVTSTKCSHTSSKDGTLTQNPQLP